MIGAFRGDATAMLAQAEGRERDVRDKFERFDVDGSGSIEMCELMSLMDDLGLLAELRSDKITFVAEMFARFDENGDELMSFDEFKKFYNCAKADAHGRVEQAAARASAEQVARARERAIEAERIRREDAELQRRAEADAQAAAAAQGAGAAPVKKQVENARTRAMKERKAKKEAERRRIAEENRAMRARLVFVA